MSLWSVSDLAAFLGGRWLLERRLTDERSGSVGELSGTAEFTQERAGELGYAERGILRLGDYEGSAWQRYCYRFPQAQRAEVYFLDGRPFHDLDLSAGLWRATHRCGQDTYEGLFRALSPGAWLLTWSATGPRKRWWSSTRYEAT